MLGGDAGLFRVVALSLGISLSATLIASVLGLPAGAALAVLRVPGRRGLILLANALLGLPPVVVGLALYLMLSRSGADERWGDGPRQPFIRAIPHFLMLP